MTPAASDLAHWLGMTSEAHTAEQQPDHYDSFAEAYARANENGLFNRWYARPAVLDLLGDVAGRRILDAGCGSGPLVADLKERGASVAGFDASPAMIRLARERLGDDADLKVADLTRPLPYDDEAFDDALAVLVLHYLKDWSGPLTELRRVLRPGGRLVVVVNHPAIPPVVYPEVDYFATTANTEEYDFDGVSATLTIWYRSLSAMSESFTAAGFRISAISEPPVSPDTPPELLPPSEFDATRFIGFIFFVLEASPTRRT
jgi:SAM-dependent methyltransferase